MKSIAAAAIFIESVLLAFGASNEAAPSPGPLTQARMALERLVGKASPGAIRGKAPVVRMHFMKLLGPTALTQEVPFEPTNSAPLQAGQFVKEGPGTNFFKGLPELTFTQAKPNEIDLGPYTLDGIAIQLLKARNPLQLLNPAAPDRYGTGTDNLNQFTFSGTGPLLTVFSVSF